MEESNKDCTGGTEKIEHAHYIIVIYCALAKITVNKTLTEIQLDAYIEDILNNGYSDVIVGKTTIYPAHTITKIEMSIV